MYTLINDNDNIISLAIASISELKPSFGITFEADIIWDSLESPDYVPVVCVKNWNNRIHYIVVNNNIFYNVRNSVFMKDDTSITHVSLELSNNSNEVKYVKVLVDEFLRKSFN